MAKHRVIATLLLLLTPQAALSWPAVDPGAADARDLPSAIPTAAPTFPPDQAPGGRSGDADGLLRGLVADPPASLAALLAVAEAAAVPPELLDRVRDPPPLAATVEALAARRRVPSPSPLPALPPDVERAVSALGQAVLGAEDLAVAGEAAAGAALLLTALADADPVLRRAAILEARRDAFAPAPASVPEAPPARNLSLSEALLRLYAALDLPVSVGVAASAREADALHPDVRLPLARSLSNLLVAIELRNAAVADLSPAEAEALTDPQALIHALTAPTPLHADLARIIVWSDAARHVDLAALEAAAIAVERAALDLRAASAEGLPPGIVFQDPYGLVLVTGPGSTTVEASVGGRAVNASVPPILPSPPGRDAFETALAELDEVAEDAPDAGVWAHASATVRAWIDAAYGAPAEVPSNVTVVVNPGGYQVLHWDLGGDDSYLTNAAGSGSRGLLQLRGDGVAGRVSPAVLAQPLPVSLLVDAGGDDEYETRDNDTLASSRAGIALLLDRAGNDRYVFAGAGRGLASASLGGFALLSDEDGSDAYLGGRDALARADSLGVAALADAAGNDTYSGDNRTLAYAETATAVLLDLAGDDRYEANGPAARGQVPPGSPGVAALVDLAGSDSAACQAETGADGIWGRLVLGRAETGGACLAPRRAGDVEAEVPSAAVWTPLASFELPGVLRFDPDGDDLVDAPYLLSIDLLGDDVYSRGAVARLPDLDLPDLGLVAPVSVYLDFDGANVLELNATAGGGFGHADGGVAVQAFLRALPEPARNTLRNVTVGAAAASRGGVALYLSDGFATEAEPVSSPACRLACASGGGIALFHSTGGPGDEIHVANGTAGAVDGASGGLAAYVRRGGPDRFVGSREGMGVVRRPLATTSPVVVVFLKDGWSRDSYDDRMTAGTGARPLRGNERVWDDLATADEVRLYGASRVAFARGIDNLHWYLDSRVAGADEGVAARMGPALPAAPAAANGLANLPVLEPGNGGTATGGDGARPVALARAPLAPLVNVEAIGTTAESSLRPVASVTRIDFAPVMLRTRIRNPPAHADATLGGAFDDGGAGGLLRDGSTIQRVELLVEGLHARWDTCPAPGKADERNPAACVVVRWDRDVDPFDRTLGSASDFIRRKATSAPLGLGAEWTLFDVVWTPTSGDAERAWYPPGEYLLTIRAYAARPGGPDALNYTDDSYGLYGAAYHLRLPVLMAPSFRSVTIRDAGGPDEGLQLRAKATEPVRWRADVYAAKTRSALLPTETVADTARRVRSLSGSTSPSWATGEPYASLGYEPLVVEWDGRDDAGGQVPPGRYHLVLEVEGKISARMWSEAPLPDYVVFVDRDPPATGARVDLVGSATVTASNAPDGRFELAIPHEANATKNRLRNPAWPTAAPAAFPIRLWVQEDVLDAADPGVVLESRPWRMIEVAQGTPRVDPRDPNLTYDAVGFQGDPVPGPPRVYRFAAHVTDRAGNAPPPAAPVGPDCLPSCAEVFYDITPPRTTLQLVHPLPEIGRASGGVVRFRLDASATPDVASVLVDVAVARNAEDFAREDFRAADVAAVPDGTLAFPIEETLPHGSRLAFRSRGIDRAGNAETKAAHDVLVTIDRAAPALVAAPTWAATPSTLSVSFEADERATATLRLDGPTILVVSAPAFARRHLLRLEGVLPDSLYAAELVLTDEAGNVAALALGEIRTPSAYDLRMEPLPPVVSGTHRVGWSTLLVPGAETVYNASLSLDGAATFPISLTPRPVRLVEPGGVARAVSLSAAGLESQAAVVRVEAWSPDDPSLRSVALSPPFVIDGVGPAVAVKATRGVDGWANGTVHLDVRGYDAASGLAWIEWSRDNATFASSTGVVEVTNGGNVFVRAVDRAGNVGPTSRLLVRIDVEEPILHVPDGLPATAQATARLVVDASDSQAGLAHVEAATPAGRADAAAAALVGGRVVLDVPLPAADGPVNATVVARDAAGNAATRIVALMVDRRAPVLALEILETHTTSLRVAVQADEPSSLSLRYRGAGGERTVTLQNGTATLAGLLPGRAYAVHAEGTDAAGNVGRLTVDVATARDALAPARVLLDGASNPDGSVALWWTRSDDDSGIAAYEVARRIGESWMPLGGVAAPFFLDPDPPPPEAAYRVVPVDVAGNRGEPAHLVVPVHHAPKIERVDISVRAAEGLYEVSVAVEVSDPDGQLPLARFVLGNVTRSLDLVRAVAPGRWSFATVVRTDLPLASPSHRWHVEASDGVLVAREPAAGQASLPAAEGSLGTQSRSLEAALLLPLGAAVALAGVAAALWRWRR